MPHGKPCATMHAKANERKTHGMPCVHMYGTWNVYKMGWRLVHRGGEEQKGKEEKKEKREREREKRERERGRKEVSVLTVGTRRTKK